MTETHIEIPTGSPPPSTEGQHTDLHTIRAGGRAFYILGTAHVSKASADLVESTINELAPDVVCVELCEGRYESLRDPDRWKNTNIVDVIRQKKLLLMLVQVALAGFQKRLATQFGIRPGEEIRRALDVSASKNIPLALVDRDIRTTLRRAWAGERWWTCVEVIAALIGGVFATEEISEKDIEALKQGDTLTALVSEFGDKLPHIKQTLIDERDRYLAAKIAAADGKNVLAVVGAGHVPGILRTFELGVESVDLAELDKIPPPTRLAKTMKWLMPAAVVLGVVLSVAMFGAAKGAKMFGIWAVINGIGAGLGAVAALAHPLTIAVAVVSAPFAVLHPLIAVGWICALVEAVLRQPTVADFETVADDLSSLRGLWHNRLGRLFLVFVLPSIGSILGSAVGVYLAYAAR